MSFACLLFCTSVHHWVSRHWPGSCEKSLAPQYLHPIYSNLPILFQSYLVFILLFHSVVKFFDTRPKAHFSASNLRDWHFLHVRTISNNMCIPRPGQTMKLHEFLTCVGWLQRIQDFSCWAVLWRVVWFRIISVTSVACFFVFGSLCCPA